MIQYSLQINNFNFFIFIRKYIIYVCSYLVHKPSCTFISTHHNPKNYYTFMLMSHTHSPLLIQWITSARLLIGQKIYNADVSVLIYYISQFNILFNITDFYVKIRRSLLINAIYFSVIVTLRKNFQRKNESWRAARYGPYGRTSIVW